MYYGFEACICDKLIAYGRKMDFLRKEAERQESADFMSNRKPVNLWQGRHKKVNDEERF
jgi:hypothetical protein